MASELTSQDQRPCLWREGAMPLKQWARFSSDNIDAVHSHMCRMFGVHQLSTQGGTPPVSFRHHQAVLRGITLNATDYGNPYGQMSIDIPALDEFFFVQLPLAGHAQITIQNRTFDLVPGALCVLGGHVPARQVFDKDYKHVTVKIPKSDLEAVIAKEFGDLRKSLEFKPVAVELTKGAWAFARLVRAICDDIDEGSTTYTHPRVYQTVEDMLKRLLLAGVPHNHADLFNRAAAGPAPYYLRRVEEYIRCNATGPVSFSDLVEASGVSGRSLHSGFRRFRDDTPMGYLKKYRLDLAHKMLKIGIDEGRSVTEIAFACGFTHLSKFANSYLERFKERPSDTLKRLG